MTDSVLRLHENDKAIAKEPQSAFTIPARFYHDKQIYDNEKAAVFYRHWWFVGHINQFKNAGEYVTTDIHQQRVFVIRGRDGELRAFYNVCQHRGHGLLEGQGRTNAIVCPYHAWCYNQDGSLRHARNTDEMLDFVKSDFDLRPVRVEVYCGMVFVNLDNDAVPLAEQAGDLAEEIKHYCPRIDELVFAQRDTYHVKANWKVLLDNFLECYHCHPAHRDFVDLVDMDSYRTITHGIYSSQCSGKARSGSNKAFSFEPGDVDFGYAGWYLWPNLTIWVYPGEANLSILKMIPNGPERTIEYQDWYILSEQPTPQLREAMAYQKDVLQPEDIGLCESVQQGLHSKGYNQGRFVVDPRFSELSEHAVHHFQQLYLTAMEAKLSAEAGH